MKVKYTRIKPNHPFVAYTIITLLSAGILVMGMVSLSFAQDGKPVTVKVKLDKPVAKIGEKFRYTLVVSSPADFEVELPVFGASIGSFDIKDFKQRTSRFFGKKNTVAYLILENFQVGKSAIPKLSVKYRAKGTSEEWKEAEVPEEPFEVISLLNASANQTPEIKDIKGPLKPKNKAGIIIIIAVIILALGAVIVILSRIKRKKKEEVAPRRPAYEIALEQLERLKLMDLSRPGKIKEYYFEISVIIRVYLEDRFNLRAPEMTTEEFLIRVQDYPQLAGGYKALLKEFLLACDLVKFAKYLPSRKEIDAVFVTAVNFVEQTKNDVS